MIKYNTNTEVYFTVSFHQIINFKKEHNLSLKINFFKPHELWIHICLMYCYYLKIKHIQNSFTAIPPHSQMHGFNYLQLSCQKYIIVNFL
jgi:hypothetical protein